MVAGTRVFDTHTHTRRVDLLYIRASREALVLFALARPRAPRPRAPRPRASRPSVDSNQCNWPSEIPSISQSRLEFIDEVVSFAVCRQAGVPNSWSGQTSRTARTARTSLVPQQWHRDSCSTHSAQCTVHVSRRHNLSTRLAQLEAHD